MKRLVNEYGSYTETGFKVYTDLRAVILPILKELTDCDLTDFRYVLNNTTDLEIVQMQIRQAKCITKK